VNACGVISYSSASIMYEGKCEGPWVTKNRFIELARSRCENFGEFGGSKSQARGCEPWANSN
jgi:hypothetical protein